MRFPGLRSAIPRQTGACLDSSKLGEYPMFLIAPPQLATARSTALACVPVFRPHGNERRQARL